VRPSGALTLAPVRTTRSPDRALYVVRVLDSVDERIAGHGSREYTSPAQPLEDALALAGLLLDGAVAAADCGQRFTRRVAIAGGRRTVTLERADTRR
jgi:hypothetical protein